MNSYYLSIDEVARSYIGLPRNAETLKLYRNLGNGTFRNVSVEAGLERVLMPMAGNFGDVNNDGFLDMYLGMGSPSFASMSPHELLLNQGGKSFVSVTASSGTGELHKGHGIAIADLDHDGDADIVAEIGGAVPADRHGLRLFENPGNRNDWINLRLVGVRSNRAGDRRPDSRHGGESRGRERGGSRAGDALDSSYRRQRRVVRGEPDGAARRAGAVCPDQDPGDLVAGQQHPANLLQRHAESVD